MSSSHIEIGCEYQTRTQKWVEVEDPLNDVGVGDLKTEKDYAMKPWSGIRSTEKDSGTQSKFLVRGSVNRSKRC